MLKLSLSGNMDQFYDLLKNRFVLLLAEKKLHHTVPFIKFQFTKSAIVENIDNTILIFEQSPDKASMMIRCSKKKSATELETHLYGLAARRKSVDEFEIYIDIFAEAINKGILSKNVVNKRVTSILAVVIISMALIGLLIVLNIFIIMLMIIAYPIFYFIQRRKFKRKQKVMNVIVSIFEGEFKTLKKTDTKDWVNFWGRVKSGAEETVFSGS